MNERIEKLGEQVDLLGEFTPTRIPGRYVGYITREQIEKFAELIVRECLSKVDASHPLEERSEWGQNSFAEETIKRKIKQHFGVE